jgi:hypothetical protein
VGLDLAEEPVQRRPTTGRPSVRYRRTSSSLTTKACVPAERRIKPMVIDGKKVYQIGIPIHQGYCGIAEDEGLDRA